MRTVALRKPKRLASVKFEVERLVDDAVVAKSEVLVALPVVALVAGPRTSKLNGR
jgi:hypothetical protein